MKLTHLHVLGFGVWSELELQSLAPLTVFYGANEAGKTTILECLRGLLFGFSPSRRDRYLPPVHGGQAGAQAGLRIGMHDYVLRRFDDGSRLTGGVTVTAPDGTTQGESHLAELLGGIDERTYTSVFAVSLREMQELATLNDTQAAEWLYDLSTGLAGVSISEVLSELRSSRTRILSRDGESSRLIELIQRRQEIRDEVERLGELFPRFWQLARELVEIDSAVDAAEKKGRSVSTDIQKIQIALRVREPWRERSLVDERIAEHDGAAKLPADSLARLERILAGLRKARHLRHQIKRRRQALAGERRTIQVNEPLWRQAARIAALAEHEPWIATLEDQLRAANERTAEHEDRLAAACAKFGLSASAATEPRAWSRDGLASLRVPAGQLRAARKRLKETRDESRALAKAKEARRNDVTAALAGRRKENLSQALEEQGQLVAQYRRRLQLDDRLDQLALHRQELQERHARCVDRQVMPLWLLVLIAVVFVVGAGLVLAGLIIPLGTGIAIAGGLVAAAAVGCKLWYDRTTSSRLNAAKRQLQMLEGQLQQAKQERGELDRQLPQGGGALASRLQAAETELASLEKLLSVDAHRQAAEEEAAAAKRQLTRAAEDWSRALHRWKQALNEAGLPEDLKPPQIKQIIAQSDSLQALRRDWAQAREEQNRYRRELAGLAGRVEQIESDSGLDPSRPDETTSLVNRLRHLRREVATQEALVDRRGNLEHKLDRLRRWSQTLVRRARALVRRRRELFSTANAADEHEFRRLAAERSALVDLLKRRTSLSQEIQATLDGRVGEAEIMELVAQPREILENRIAELGCARDEAADEVKRLWEQRGQLAAEQSRLATDRRLAEKQLDLDTIEAQIADIAARWRVLAITERLIDSIKSDYEQSRQPEVLQEASRYLNSMTEGRYRRVWTPLDQNRLFVDDDHERALPTELLSTGAREQLFLCLRLALVARYARLGKPMPLALDDVLVNFDRARAAAAARVIADFAAAGNQIVLFTCHEHIATLFRLLGSDVRVLPAASDASHKIVEPLSIDIPPASEPPQRRREKRPKGPKSEEEAERKSEEVSVSTNQPQTTSASETYDSVAFPPSFLPPDATGAPAAVSLADRTVEPPPALKAARRRRVDSPHRALPATTSRRRWSAEEFEGELEDQVNADVAMVFAPPLWAERQPEVAGRRHERDHLVSANGEE